MLDKMKPYRLSIVLALLIGYLGVQALTGERGLLSGGERDALLRQREEQLAHLVEQGGRLGVGAVGRHQRGGVRCRGVRGVEGVKCLRREEDIALDTVLGFGEGIAEGAKDDGGDDEDDET